MAKLVLDDPEETYWPAQRAYLAQLARLLPDDATLRACHEDGGFDSALLFRLDLSLAERARWEVVEQDGGQGNLARVSGQLLRHALLRTLSIPVPQNWHR